jgi:hypothetical protein
MTVVRVAVALALAWLSGDAMVPLGRPSAPVQPSTLVVSTTPAFRAAVSAARPGTTISVAPGVYTGGSFHANVAGAPGAPVVIQGADRTRPPVFSGGANGIQFSDASHVILRDLVFDGAAQNGINIDDGGTFATPAHHIVFTRVTVRNIPSGNRDGIKLSGVTDFVVEDSVVTMWGDEGSAIDMVGCHRGVIRSSVFGHRPDLTFGNGIQAKGGSTGITITGNRFEHAAARAVQIGGTTSLTLFRPQPHDRAEARDVIVERNVFIGGQAPVAFVGSDGGMFRFNTIYLPALWPLRILQEHLAPGMVPSRNGAFTDNIVYWRGPQTINIGANTAASTFTFARNWWYREDAPAASRIPLPGPESGGVYGVDPKFVAPPENLRTLSAVPHGAYAP